MGASKPKTASTLGAGFELARLLWRPQNRGLVLTGIVVLAAIVGSIYGWQQWGELAIRSPEYLVASERISVTPQPAWIHSNVKADVLRSLTGAKLELLDRELVEKIADAFALHPWVAKVVRVEKQYPARVSVELYYRRPVLVVKIDAPGDDGLLFLDEESVLLPSSDFAPTQAKDYLRIGAAGETPTSVYGTPWGSQRIAGAAAVAAAVGDRWQALGLYSIVATRSAGSDYLYELRSQDEKVRLVWGRTPGHESSGEPMVGQKIAAMEQIAGDKDPLEKSGASRVIDLRDLAAGAKKSAARGTRRVR